LIRERLSKREAAVQNGFRLRGLGEVSRVEALSDGVIAFAITLLVVSVALALTRGGRYTAFSGMAYWLIAPVLFIHGHMRGKRRRRIEARLAGESVGLNAAAN
jgi:hypothetical protein